MEREIIFSERVKALRLSAGLTQPQLGAAVGLSKQAVNGIEHGRRHTTLRNACVLADYFGVSLDYLVGRSDDPGGQPPP
ncbi:MAG: helix-turn-helix domain-containing protein [Clostridiales Family XIII bacterium]|jgi:transcriptional regulator with XRE-family HTH domain|nr:helix-turn-helix domain-containing protein [Clostridiales Family XIII bacterium]